MKLIRKDELAKLLRNRLMKLMLLNFDKYRNKFVGYRRNVKGISTNENAVVIQNFLRSKLNNPSDKRNRISRGADFLTLYIKRLVLNRLKEEAKQNLMKRVLLIKMNLCIVINRFLHRKKRLTNYLISYQRGTNLKI